MRLIELYDIKENGFHPVLIRGSWQAAKLNYADEYHINHLKFLIKHQKSDKALSLLIGNAILIANIDCMSHEFKIVPMKRGTSYNIPKNVWYAIAMREGSQLFIVEKPNTHRDDVTACYLDEVQLKRIRRNVNKGFKKIR